MQLLFLRSEEYPARSQTVDQGKKYLSGEIINNWNHE